MQFQRLKAGDNADKLSKGFGLTELDADFLQNPHPALDPLSQAAPRHIHTPAHVPDEPTATCPLAQGPPPSHSARVRRKPGALRIATRLPSAHLCLLTLDTGLPASKLLAKRREIVYVFLYHESHDYRQVIIMPTTLPQISLTPDDLEKFPPSLRVRIQNAFGPNDFKKSRWVLVGTPTTGDERVLGEVLTRLPAVLDAHTRENEESNIAVLMDMMANNQAMPATTLEIRNARIRAEYLDRVQCYKAAEVREQSGLKPKNPSEPASRWKREGKIFALRKAGIDLYPSFQFRDGQPRPVIKRILTILEKDYSPWQIAFWFEGGNGWLDGAKPKNCLEQFDEVVLAAYRLAEPTYG